MSRIYTAVFEGVAVAATQDLFELLAPADATVRIHRIQVDDDNSETSERLTIRFVRGEGTVTSGSGGSVATAVPTSKGDAAFGGTVETNNTTKMVVGTGALKTLQRSAFDILAGFDWHPTPEERIDISPSDRMTVELVTAPASSRVMSGTITFEEIGG
jgi:hypothetical protein